MYFAYSLLTLMLFVVASPYFVYQAIRYKKYTGSLRQRLGFLPISHEIHRPCPVVGRSRNGAFPSQRAAGGSVHATQYCSAAIQVGAFQCA